MKTLVFFLCLSFSLAEEKTDIELVNSLIGADRKDELVELEKFEHADPDSHLPKSISNIKVEKSEDKKFSEIEKAYDDSLGREPSSIEKDIPIKNDQEPINLLEDSDDDAAFPPGFFDFKDFLLKLENLDCKDLTHKSLAMDVIESQDEDEVKSLCDDAIRNSLLYPMSKSDHHALDLFNYLNKNIYLPLGVDMAPKYYYPDVLSDLFFLNEKNYMITKDVRIPTNEQFAKEVSNIFSDIETYSSEFEANKDLISKLIVDVLKRFHIFWNVHRTKSQMHSVGKNTLSIIKYIISKYHTTSENMAKISQHILDNIKEGYYRFQKANKSIAIIASQPVELISLEIVRRYKENLERLVADMHAPETMCSEYGFMLDLYRAFVIVNYKLGVSNEEVQKRYTFAIFEKIKLIFETYKRYMIENNINTLLNSKIFTATVLLKIHHRNYLIYTYYGVSGYLSLPVFIPDNHFGKIAKIYYQYFDHLMLVPVFCAETLENGLERCVRQKMFGIMSDLYTSYELFNSVASYDLLNFFSVETEELIAKAIRRGVFSSTSNFKNFYYAELFGLSERYRQRYNIKDFSFMEEFESKLAEQIAIVRQNALKKGEPIEVYENLDKELYNFFIQTKTKLNAGKHPLTDVIQLGKIQKDAFEFLDSFKVDNFESIEKDADLLLFKMKNMTKEWIDGLSKRVADECMHQNALTPITQSMPLVSPGSQIIEHVINEPVIASAQLMPMDSNANGTPL